MTHNPARPATSRKVILTCAVTGSIHTPSMSPHLPFRPEDVAAQAVEAAEAGAAILHLHARDPETGRPSPDPALFRDILGRIAARTDAVLNVTTGGSSVMTLDDRIAGALATEPEMCSFNLGSMNFALHPMLDRYATFEHAWERPFLEASKGAIFRNTFEDMERIVRLMGDERGARFEFECYDTGHLFNLAHLADRGVVKPPFFVQFVMGVLGGVPATPDILVHLRQTAERLFGDAFRWSCLAAGRAQIPLATMAAVMGGHVRVGLEDSLFLRRGELAQSNAEQVRRMRGVLEALDLDLATPDEARAMLGLKGAAATAVARG